MLFTKKEKKSSLQARSTRQIPPKNATRMQIGITIRSCPSLNPAHQLHHLPRILAGLLEPLCLHILLPILNLPGSGDALRGPSHAVDHDDQRFEESDAGALEDVHGHERPAEQGGADGHVPRGRAPELVGVEAVVDGVHLRAVDRVAAVRVGLGDQVAGGAQEAADGRSAERHFCYMWLWFKELFGCFVSPKRCSLVVPKEESGEKLFVGVRSRSPVVSV